ncbi:MAG: hypothetical protein IIC21_11740 [Chloroflexi bacterium]|nr:hypothetical protein [Chloroflexota bacterium]
MNHRVTPISALLAGMDQHRLLTPWDTHKRPATCQEIDCNEYLNGWTVVVDVTTEIGKSRQYTIEHEAGRRYTKSSLEEGKVVYDFEPGQACFLQSRHTILIGRSPDHRILKAGVSNSSAHPKGRLVGHTEWMDDYGETAFQFNLKRERG